MLQEMWLVHGHGERAEQVCDHEVLLWTLTRARKEASGKARRDQTQGARPREHGHQVKSKRNWEFSKQRMVSQVSV